MGDRFDLGRFRALRGAIDTAEKIDSKARTLLGVMGQAAKEAHQARLGVQVVSGAEGSDVIAEFKSPFGNARIVLLWAILRADAGRAADVVCGRLVAFCPDPLQGPEALAPVWQMYIPKDGEPWIPDGDSGFIVHLEDSFGHNLSTEVFVATMDLLTAIVERKPIHL